MKLNKSHVLFSHIAFGIMIMATQFLNAQSIQKNDSCAANLARNYFLNMGISDSIHSKKMPLIFTEALSGKDMESQSTGVFIVSNFNAHRKKLILLKNGNRIKLLTFSKIHKSLEGLISFLDDLKTTDEDLFKYIDFIKEYLESSKSKIKVINKLEDSNWIECNSKI